MDWSYVLAMIGVGIMVGMSGVGSAIGTAIGGQSVVGMLKKRPEQFGSAMVLAAMPATQGLYGFVGFIIYNGKLQGIGPELSIVQASVVLGAGIMLGLAALLSGIHQGRVCAAGISGIGSGHDVFGNTLILGAFPEFYAILALVSAILAQGLMVVA